MFTRKLPTRRGSFKLAAVVAPVLAAASLLLATPAGAAVTLGPNGGGQMSGIAYCNAVTHQISINYLASPEYQPSSNFSSILVTMNPVPEWVEVYAYVKLSSSSNWGAPVAHGYSYVDHPMTVLNSLRSAYAGYNYDIGFYARAAYPGGNWSNWIWDRPELKTSFSGTSYADYGYCRT
ncbi:MAG TPA: hypothetical protein VL769_03145 [Acidimicrobiia bacterium]|jgi:hypothetical protein|nr:hypothetical protein [Acidimicrobiia bacterium]